jgi:drug/metabolite transporter (DMT)-like permease
MKAFFYTAFALTAFAFNSILCRLALGAQAIDAASFTTVRLISGVAALVLIGLVIGKKESIKKSGNWISAFFLFAYAICFSFAYVNLTTATGALILFGSVQATMIFAAFAAGEKPKMTEMIGLVLAVGGLIYLVFPGLSAPPPVSSALMTFAGVSWGFYTLRGRGSSNPLAETTGNFLRAAPLAVLTSLLFAPQIHLSGDGFTFAVLSGAIASGIGYAVWYSALKYHTATRAAILQLSVPVLAAFGGVVLLAESVSARLVTAAIIIIGGILTAIAGRKYDKNKA